MAKEFAMITPFQEKQLSSAAISFGPSSYGYDIRIADEFKILKSPEIKEKSDSDGAVGGEPIFLDPKAIDKELFVDFKGDFCVIPPNSFILGRSVEYFRIPRSVLALSVGKSTYARVGVIVNVTPLEPCWEGFLTIEISNTSPYPVKIYSGEGISQLIFLGSDEECEFSYSDKKGKYQKQDKITLPILQNNE